MTDIITANADILCIAGTLVIVSAVQQAWDVVRRNDPGMARRPSNDGQPSTPTDPEP